MNIANETPFTFAPFMGKVIYPRDTLTVIVKGTFRLTPGKPAQPVDVGEHFPPTGDQYYDNDPRSSCRYASDFVHFKPKADVLLAGHCHAPGGTAVPACNVRFHVGGNRKALMVFGDRRWQRTKIGSRTMSDPTPFVSMEVRYEKSFGGPDYRNNPVGKGIHAQKDKRGRTHHKLANLKVLEGETLKTMIQGTPAGFGPLGRTWGHRMTLAGHYGEKWRRERWPWLPEDFNWGYCNDAPPDQQLKGYLKGDEPLYFENLHPEHAAYHSALPGVRIRCFLSEQHNGENRFREINTQLDTLWVDMDAENLILVWRGLATVATPECDEVNDLLIVQEPVAEKPGSLEYYHGVLERRKEDVGINVTTETEAGEEEGVDPQAGNAPDVEGTVDAELQAGLNKSMAEAKEVLDRSSLEGNRVNLVKTEREPEDFLEKLGMALGIDTAAAEKVKAHARKIQQQALDKNRQEIETHLGLNGGDAGSVDDAQTFLSEEQDATEEEADPASEANSDWDPSGADFSGKSLEGADFREAQLDGADFSTARLAGADFSEASLVRANFENADLTGVDLTRADLSHARMAGAVFREADLSGAVLVQANLAHADLTGCALPQVQLDHANLTQATLRKANLKQADITGGDLTQADLREAVLDFAILDGAVLTQADLCQAKANQSSFQGCILLETHFGGADLEESDFSQCRCDHADFQAARLNRATFEGVAGRHVNFREAGLEQIRAGDDARLPESIFRRACGAKGNWAGSDLQGADLILAEMPFCDFSGATLTGSDCRTAELKGAVFDKAVLNDVLFNRANLFQSRMEQAQLAGTNFKGANLYGSEFLNASIDKQTNFRQANLKGTKLADLKI